MAMSNCEIVKIIKCFALWCALLAVSTNGRSLQRIHRHQHSVKVKNLTELRLEEEALVRFYDHMARHHFRDRHLVNDDLEEDSSFDEDTQALRLPEKRDHHHHCHRHSSSYRRSHAINKRHNGVRRDAPLIVMNEKHNKMFEVGPSNSKHDSSDPDRNKHNEVEVKQAQNISLCNYTVEDIPDPSEDQSRIPKVLMHVKCNHGGSCDPDVEHHVCIQTFGNITVSYGNGREQTIKIYTGCVCAKPPPPLLKVNAYKQPNIS